MKLRKWQKQALKAALARFNKPFTHFLNLSTPGSGKTFFAATVADSLLKMDKVDLVLCFSPSTIIAYDFKDALENVTKERFDGRIGAKGLSLTYQSMRYLTEAIWDLLKQNRVFVIFDEIHHCAGHNTEYSNAWGKNIISRIQGRAHYTLSLTGTPWRTDPIPISLAEYNKNDYLINVDFSYSLREAINDKVCRRPKIISFDCKSVAVKENVTHRSYRSFSELLKSKDCSYLDVIMHDSIIDELLHKGNQKLNTIRKKAPNAGGLIVASSITHAKQIQSRLTKLGEESVLVCYQFSNSAKIINDFRHSTSKWIVSIGQISEGTNIPRLRLCCYLTIVTTELYFRQVLGRILRNKSDQIETGYLLMPAHPKLVEFAIRLGDEIGHYAEFEQDPTLDSVTMLNEDLLSHPIEMESIEDAIADTECFNIGNMGDTALHNDFLNRNCLTTIERVEHFYQQIYEL